MKSGRPAGEREGKHRKTSDIHLTAAMEQTIPKRQVALIAIIRAEQRPWVWWGQSRGGEECSLGGSWPEGEGGAEKPPGDLSRE